MVVTYAIAASVEIIDLSYEQASHTLWKNSNLGCSKSKIPAVNYKLTEDQEVKMTRHTIEESKNSQLYAKDRQNEENISEMYSEYQN